MQSLCLQGSLGSFTTLGTQAIYSGIQLAFLELSSLSYIARLFTAQVSSKDEEFLDLSVDVENNTSITHCLRGFSSTETLRSEHKYSCEVCCSKQEAQKRYVYLSTTKCQIHRCLKYIMSIVLRIQIWICSFKIGAYINLQVIIFS